MNAQTQQLQALLQVLTTLNAYNGPFVEWLIGKGVAVQQDADRWEFLKKMCEQWVTLKAEETQAHAQALTLSDSQSPIPPDLLSVILSDFLRPQEDIDGWVFSGTIRRPDVFRTPQRFVWQVKYRNDGGLEFAFDNLDVIGKSGPSFSYKPSQASIYLDKGSDDELSRLYKLFHTALVEQFRILGILELMNDHQLCDDLV